MTAHLDRARVADQLQLWRWERFGKFGINGNRSRPGRDRNRYRDDSTAGGRILIVDMRRAIAIVVVMDGRTMMMVAMLWVVRNGVNVERERL